MINLGHYSAYFKEIAHKIGIENLVFVVKEEHLRSTLKNLTGKTLAVVYPSFRKLGSEDNHLWINEGMFLLLDNGNEKSMTQEREEQLFTEIGELCAIVINNLIHDHSTHVGVMAELDISSIQAEPEWMICNSWCGYSVTYTF